MNKIEAIKLSNTIGTKEAAEELGIQDGRNLFKTDTGKMIIETIYDLA